MMRKVKIVNVWNLVVVICLAVLAIGLGVLIAQKGIQVPQIVWQIAGLVGSIEYVRRIGLWSQMPRQKLQPWLNLSLVGVLAGSGLITALDMVALLTGQNPNDFVLTSIVPPWLAATIFFVSLPAYVRWGHDSTDLPSHQVQNV